MAARTIKIRHDDETRSKIRTTQLLKRLDGHVFNPAEVEISQTQMKAIEILLRKSLPDLASVELTGNADQPLKLVVEWSKE